MKKLCVILNLAPHYRKAIFQAIDNEFNCDWYVGDRVEDIKTMSPDDLKRCKIIKNKAVYKHNYIQKGMLRLLLSRQYSRFLVTGDIRNISLWLFLLLSKLLPNKKVYTWTHGSNGKGGRLSNIFKKVFASLSDGIFLYGNYARDYMISQGSNPKKLYVIHNSLDHSSQLTFRKQLSNTDVYKKHFKNDYLNLIFIGRLTAVKRLDLLVTAVSLLAAKGCDYNIIFVGDGQERENLEKLVESYGLSDRVWFYGACYDELKNAELIYNADLCVSPGNVGLTAIHSLMYGTPVATNNNFLLQMPEFEAVIEGKTGTYFDYDNAQSIAEAIDKWFGKFGNKRYLIRENCMNEIDSNWTPQYQINILKTYLSL